MSSLPSASPIGFLQHRTGDLVKNRYQVLSHLGGGSFGSVYRVRDVAVGVELACKEMHVLDDPATPADERAAALELFKREALNLATIRHPHIPAAYFEQEDGNWQICPRCGLDWPNSHFCPDHGAPLLPVSQRFYLMMDFVDGPTLEELAQSALRENGRPLDETVCLDWTTQIASALRALHRVGIVHRDIKPDNIKIRTVDNAAVLLDFGLTRKAEEAGGYGTFRQRGSGHLGTPGYAPPDLQELARPEPRSDIYALGMTLYRLLSGRDPQEPRDLAAMREESPRFFNAAISPAVESVIQRATQSAAAGRYADIDELLADLESSTTFDGRGTGRAPFVFPDGARVRNATELARLLDERGAAAARLIFDGSLGQWLESVGQTVASRAAAGAAVRYENHPSRAVEMLRRALLSGAADALPRLQIEPSRLEFGAIDSGAVAVLAVRLRNMGGGLSWGRIAAVADDGASADLPGVIAQPTWEGNDLAIEIEIDSSRLSNGEYSGTLEFFEGEDERTPAARVRLSFAVRPLSLRVEPSELDFGTVAIGEVALRFVRVTTLQSTAGRAVGRPRGTFYVPRELGPIVAPSRFEGDEPFKITLDGVRSGAVAKRYEGALHIDTNGGRLSLPVRFDLVLRPSRLLLIVGTYVLIGGCGAGLFRFSYAIVNPDFAARWLVENGTIAPPTVAGYGAPLLLGALAGALFEVWRWTNDDAPIAAGRTRAHSLRVSPLLQSLLLSGVLGAMLCWPLIWALHWISWGVGDWLLRAGQALWQMPLRSLGIAPERAAPWVWGATGALVGALIGVGRIGDLLGRPLVRYAIWALLAVFLLIAFINAAIFIGP